MLNKGGWFLHFILHIEDQLDDEATAASLSR